MANPLNYRLINKTFLSPLFHFSDDTKIGGTTQGEKNRTALLGRIKKMDQSTRQDLIAQLQKAVEFIKKQKEKAPDISPFYAAALCLMVTRDDELPVPKVGILTNLIRTIAHLLGLRISSEDIAKKITMLRAELVEELTGATEPEGVHMYGLSDTNPHLTQTRLSIEEAALKAAQTEIEFFTNATAPEGIPKAITAFKDLKEKFTAAKKKNWSDTNVLLEYLTAVNSVVSELKTNEGIRGSFKTDAEEFIQVVSDYLGRKAANMALEQENLKIGLEEEANKDKANLFVKRVNEECTKSLEVVLTKIRKDRLLPSKTIYKLRSEILRLAEHDNDFTHLQKLEQKILSCYQDHCLSCAIQLFQKTMNEFATQKESIEAQMGKTEAVRVANDIKTRREDLNLRKEIAERDVKSLQEIFGNITSLTSALKNGMSGFKSALQAATVLIIANVKSQQSKFEKFYDFLINLERFAFKPETINSAARIAIAGSIDLNLMNDGVVDAELHRRLDQIKTSIDIMDFTQETVRIQFAQDYLKYIEIYFNSKKCELEQELNRINTLKETLNPKLKQPVIDKKNPPQATKVEKVEPAPLVPPAVSIPTTATGLEKTTLTAIAKGIQDNQANESAAKGYYIQLREKDKGPFFKDLTGKIYGNLFWNLHSQEKVGPAPGDEWGRKVFLGEQSCEGVSSARMNFYRATAIVEVLNGRIRSQKEAPMGNIL